METEAWIKRPAAAEMTEKRRLLVIVKTQPEPWPPDGKIAEAPKCTFWSRESQGSLNPPLARPPSAPPPLFSYHTVEAKKAKKKRNTCSTQCEHPGGEQVHSACVCSPFSLPSRFSSLFHSSLWAPVCRFFISFPFAFSFQALLTLLRSHIWCSITSHLLHVRLSVTQSRDVHFSCV